MVAAPVQPSLPVTKHVAGNSISLRAWGRVPPRNRSPLVRCQSRCNPQFRISPASNTYASCNSKIPIWPREHTLPPKIDFNHPTTISSRPIPFIPLFKSSWFVKFKNLTALPPDISFCNFESNLLPSLALMARNNTIPQLSWEFPTSAYQSHHPLATLNHSTHTQPLAGSDRDPAWSRSVVWLRRLGLCLVCCRSSLLLAM